MGDQGNVEGIIIILILVVYVVSSHAVDTMRLSYIHQSVVVILLGAVVALIVHLFSDKDIVFSNSLFFNLILPPIIFAAGYNLRKSLFFQNFSVISFLGLVGTIITFLIVALFIWLFSLFLGKLTLSDALFLSAVLCATDSVAALTLIRQEDYPVLNSVLFGEGIINDATAIILFRSVTNSINKDSNFGMTSLWISLDFLYLFSCSLLIGMAFGLGLSFFFKKVDLTYSPVKQISLIVLVSYFAYLVSQIAGLSGIISLFVCGVITGHYCYLNISNCSKQVTGVTFDTVGYLAQAFVFAYLGLSIFSVQGEWLTVAYSVLIVPIVILARFAAVFLLPCFYYIFGKKFPLDTKQLMVCWYSGLIRGAIAFALSLQIQSQNAKLLQSIVLILVLATMITLSSLLTSFLRLLGIESSGEGPAYKEIEVESRQSQVERYWFQFEEKFVLPIFKRQDSLNKNLITPPPL